MRRGPFVFPQFSSRGQHHTFLAEPWCTVYYAEVAHAGCGRFYPVGFSCLVRIRLILDVCFVESNDCPCCVLLKLAPADRQDKSVDGS